MDPTTSSKAAHSEFKQLQALLQRRIRELSRQAVEEGSVSAEQVAEVECLARLAELGKPAPSGGDPVRSRWPVAALFGGTLAIVSVLLFARVSAAEIGLEMTASEVSFVLRRPQVLIDLLRVSTLEASGVGTIDLPRAREHAARTVEAPDGALAIALQPLQPLVDEARPGSITLQLPALPPGTRVSIQRDPATDRYRLTFNPPEDLEVRVGVVGSVHVRVGGESPAQLDVSSPRSVVLRAGSQPLEIALAAQDAGGAPFSNLFAAGSLSMERVDEYTAGDATIVGRSSTVETGTVYFESLNGEELLLRPGERLRFEESEGEIRALALRDESIHLQFSGRVKGMDTGPYANRRTLMPTYLEWLRARHGLAMLWGTALYSFGFVHAAARWWGSLS